MKKWISYICAVALVLTLLPAYALPANATDGSGKCGDDLTWTYESSTLTISGTGAMYDYSEEEPAPWNEYIGTIYYVNIEEGVTSVGAYAFAGGSMIGQIIVPSSVTNVGSMAFSNCGTRVSDYMIFLGQAPSIAQDAYNGTSIVNYLVFDWEEEMKQQYGGTISWNKADVRLNSSATRLVEQNQVFQPDDMVFYIYIARNYGAVSYVPKQVTFGPYDHSTYGEKTVTVTADGYTFEHSYFVTDGTSHLDLIQVEFPEFPEYNGGKPPLLPTVTMGSLLLEQSVHYDVAFHYDTGSEMYAQVTVTGKGICEGFEKTFYYPVLRADLANAKVNHDNREEFSGMPITPEVTASVNGKSLTVGSDYQVLYENNVNSGTATIRVVGLGDYYGEAVDTFTISVTDTYPSLQGNYLGTADGELSEDIAISQMIMSPGRMSTRITTSELHMAAYALYRVDEEEMTLIDEAQSEPGYRNDTAYIYDFSPVYEGATDIGGEVYMLAYSYVTASNKVYGGALILIIPAKVGEASSMTLQYVEGDGDFRKEYFGVSGDDGVLGQVVWTSSDPSVAEVENGTVTLKKPGTALITAQSGDLIQTGQVTAEALDLTQGIIFDYSEETGTARVVYDARLLTEGIDYVLSVEKNGDAVTVTATGCGLFTGELVKEFVDLDSLADPHTHGFTNSCDGTCNSCDFTRDNDHDLSQSWGKDQTHHWHTCLACGEKADYAEHQLLTEDACSVCGTLCSPGDVNGDGKINSLDGLMLMRYLNGWNVEIAFPDAMDVNSDGKVNSLDGLILMRYLNGWDVSLG